MDTNETIELTDLEPNDEVKGGGTERGTVTYRGESNLTYSGESGGMNEW
jgi:hypothetical protein